MHDSADGSSVSGFPGFLPRLSVSGSESRNEHHPSLGDDQAPPGADPVVGIRRFVSMLQANEDVGLACHGDVGGLLALGTVRWPNVSGGPICNRSCMCSDIARTLPFVSLAERLTCMVNMPRT